MVRRVSSGLVVAMSVSLYWVIRLLKNWGFWWWVVMLGSRGFGLGVVAVGVRSTLVCFIVCLNADRAPGFS